MLIGTIKYSRIRSSRSADSPCRFVRVAGPLPGGPDRPTSERTVRTSLSNGLYEGKIKSNCLFKMPNDPRHDSSFGPAHLEIIKSDCLFKGISAGGGTSHTLKIKRQNGGTGTVLHLTLINLVVLGGSAEPL